MNHIPALITDLALISLCAGLTTLLFKKLKQPLVLGYVLAGVLVGPALTFFPTIADKENIKLWADIGVIFLLFYLGLEFNFKKMMNVGKTGIITATCNIALLMGIGYFCGMFLKWSSVDSIFLGGMISMSSTTIIIKAFEDLDMKKQKFTELVFGVLVVEDVMGILLLVLLPTITLSNNVEITALLGSALKLAFFLIAWFISGIYVIPRFIKKVEHLLNDEMLLIISIGLCMGMVWLATATGFSEALGAFVMGSLLAGTSLSHKIQEVVKPVKDFFGAVFFVSVGMLVVPSMFLTYWWPILLITLVVLVGITVCSMIGFTISGQPPKTAIQGAFSLAQVGEFAFIIASLGISIGVLSDYVYPIIVAVSVITTFTTPMMIKAAPKFCDWLKKTLPPAWIAKVNTLTQHHAETSKEKQLWQELFKRYFLRLIVLSTIIVAIVNLIFFISRMEFFTQHFPNRWMRVVSMLVALACSAPFLRELFRVPQKLLRTVYALWHQSKYNRLPLIFLTGIRLAIGAFLVAWMTHQMLSTNRLITFLLMIGTVYVVSRSKWALERYFQIEANFLENLNMTAPEEKR